MQLRSRPSHQHRPSSATTNNLVELHNRHQFIVAFYNTQRYSILAPQSNITLTIVQIQLIKSCNYSIKFVMWCVFTNKLNVFEYNEHLFYSNYVRKTYTYNKQHICFTQTTYVKHIHVQYKII